MNRRRIAHLLLLLAGLAVAVYGLWMLADPQVTCRGVEMGPGDVCHKNDFSQLGSDQVQTYEQRLQAARTSQPVVIGMGAAMLLFGGALLGGDLRREQRTA